MNSTSADTRQHSFATLRSLARRRDPVEHCELCGRALASDHSHLVEPLAHKLVCVCEPCAILFPQGSGTRYVRVPRRVRWLQDFEMTDGQWDSLLIPIGMAFFLKSGLDDRVQAFYPSPAGPTESLLSLEAWNDIVRDNPALNDMQSDVEALLVNRLERTHQYFLAPVDKCYELVGVIRARWRGLSGGTEVWREIRGFFDDLKQRDTRGSRNA